MKYFKKIIATLTSAIMVLSSIITASADFTSVTASTSATENKVAIGEKIIVNANWDSLINATAFTVVITYDTDGFEVASGNNENYNFGNPIIPDYKAAYIADDFLKSRWNWLRNNNNMDNFNVTNMWDYFDYNAVDNEVLIAVSSTSDTAVTSAYEDLAKHSSIGATFVAKKAGTYTFNISATAATTSGRVDKTATVSVTVTGGETEEFTKIETAEDQAVTAGADAEGKYVANSKGETKFLKHIATILTSAKANKKVRINKLNANGAVESYQQSGRTLGEILGGVATPETTISGKIAVGVMTTNNSDVFSFELVD